MATFEWLGARLTFSGEFLHVLLNEVVKQSPVFLLAGLHFVYEKDENKILNHAR